VCSILRCDTRTRDSGATKVLLDEAASSAKKVPRVGLFSSRNDDLDLLLRLVRGFDISMIRECRSGWASSRRGMPASHVPIPLVDDTRVASSSGGVSLPLRRVSPNEGSSESGRGVVVLLTPLQAAFFSLEMAVIQDLSI
jgi:hypothetical protein